MTPSEMELLPWTSHEIRSGYSLVLTASQPLSYLIPGHPAEQKATILAGHYIPSTIGTTLLCNWQIARL